jgi:hypothetical protein
MCSPKEGSTFIFISISSVSAETPLFFSPILLKNSFLFIFDLYKFGSNQIAPALPSRIFDYPKLVMELARLECLLLVLKLVFQLFYCRAIFFYY